MPTETTSFKVPDKKSTTEGIGRVLALITFIFVVLALIAYIALRPSKPDARARRAEQVAPINRAITITKAGSPIIDLEDIPFNTGFYFELRGVDAPYIAQYNGGKKNGGFDEFYLAKADRPPGWKTTNIHSGIAGALRTNVSFRLAPQARVQEARLVYSIVPLKR